MDSRRLESAELAERLYSGIACLQLLLWYCHLVKHETNISALLEGFESAMREYMALAESGLAQGLEGRVTEQSLENVAKLRQFVVEWTRTGEIAPDLDRLALQCLKEMLGEEGIRGLPSVPP